MIRREVPDTKYATVSAGTIGRSNAKPIQGPAVSARTPLGEPNLRHTIGRNSTVCARALVLEHYARFRRVFGASTTGSSGARNRPV
jgi:hypothetical protein